ncbi:hypothetical protein B0T44_22825 [Nocardia donostiensis]|uniref:HTH luxR-type domain-containing protein n=1 Tax=Nocardia donostiensis TaxID=1538463 RepID=A0A1V2TG05_9NOCA|nr:hypothetical protein B0T46_12060 [Nocardia donostiensis]OQS16175.1 hypothetical protein B0T36_05150 [Nocardia donostiensis]OQS17847.1 hypothetical protein B0T44_22825 [Nocardia donostiensis]
MRLTPREIEVLNQSAPGRNNQETAENLGLRSNTIKAYLKTAIGRELPRCPPARIRGNGTSWHVNCARALIALHNTEDGTAVSHPPRQRRAGSKCSDRVHAA